MENHTQVSEVFSYLSVIWCEIVRHVKRLVREWTDDVLLSFCMCRK